MSHCLSKWGIYGHVPRAPLLGIPRIKTEDLFGGKSACYWRNVAYFLENFKTFSFEIISYLGLFCAQLGLNLPLKMV